MLAPGKKMMYNANELVWWKLYLTGTGMLVWLVQQSCLLTASDSFLLSLSSLKCLYSRERFQTYRCSSYALFQKSHFLELFICLSSVLVFSIPVPYTSSIPKSIAHTYRTTLLRQFPIRFTYL